MRDCRPGFRWRSTRDTGLHLRSRFSRLAAEWNFRRRSFFLPPELLLARIEPERVVLRQHVEGHLRAEEALQPDAVFAEVVHLPENGRTGNVILRPALRAYEIPYLGQSGVPAERQIPVTVKPVLGLVALVEPHGPVAPLFALALDDQPALREYFERLRDVRLEVDGADLAALGLEESPRVGEVLAELRRRKLNGELDGRESELEAAKELLAQ